MLDALGGKRIAIKLDQAQEPTGLEPPRPKADGHLEAVDAVRRAFTEAGLAETPRADAGRINNEGTPLEIRTTGAIIETTIGRRIPLDRLRALYEKHPLQAAELTGPINAVEDLVRGLTDPSFTLSYAKLKNARAQAAAPISTMLGAILESLCLHHNGRVIAPVTVPMPQVVNAIEAITNARLKLEELAAIAASKPEGTLDFTPMYNVYQVAIRAADCVDPFEKLYYELLGAPAKALLGALGKRILLNAD
jgi:hypothetical protein